MDFRQNTIVPEDLHEDFALDFVAFEVMDKLLKLSSSFEFHLFVLVAFFAHFSPAS